jgi:hypothetical protein
MLDFRRAFVVGTGLAMALAAPGLAAQEAGTCRTEIDAIGQQLGQSSLDEPARAAVRALLDSANQLAAADDEEGCQAILADVREVMPAAAGAETEPPAAVDAMKPPAAPAANVATTPVEPAAEQPSDAADVAAPVIEAEPADEPAVVEAPAVEEGQGAEVAAAPPIAAIPRDELIGADVVDAAGEAVGSVDDVVTGTGDDGMYVIVAHGGFLGIGESEVAVPADRFQIGAENQLILPDLSQDQLESLPEYDPQAYVQTQ